MRKAVLPALVILLLTMAAGPVHALSGGLFFSPEPGLGLVTDLPWHLRLEAQAVTSGGGFSRTAYEIDRTFPVKLKWLPVKEDFVGIRYSKQAQIVVGLGHSFKLYPDVHLDLKAGLAAPGDALYFGFRVAQDL